ncbi:MAG: NAD(P)-dependent oxidoreductase, partial [Ilumatobacteraceae bacterium]
GLGAMGGPMARHLSTAGHHVAVYNRDGEKASAWVATNGGVQAKSPRQVAEFSEVVFVCVGNDNDVRSVALGDLGVLAGMRPGTVLVDHTTASATLARELTGACTAIGVGFVDAPVSGGQVGAENGLLTVMCGCDDIAIYEKVEPIIAAYARMCKRLGDAGSGQLAKMVNQICIAGVVQGLSEGLNFAMRAGLNPDQVVDVISKGAAQSWQMENRSKTMVSGEFDFGFAVEWMRKDLAICIDEARRNGARIPMTELVDSFYEQVMAMGGRRWDTSSLIKLLTSN